MNIRKAYLRAITNQTRLNNTVAYFSTLCYANDLTGCYRKILKTRKAPQTQTNKKIFPVERNSQHKKKQRPVTPTNFFSFWKFLYTCRFLT